MQLLQLKVLDFLEDEVLILLIWEKLRKVNSREACHLYLVLNVVKLLKLQIPYNYDQARNIFFLL
jgi:hypothetical protein